MIDKESLRLRYFQNDIPVPYKLKEQNKIIEIHPISVKDWFLVEDLALLQIEKNEINNIDILKMSYLQFMNEVYFNSYPNDKNKFLSIFCLAFKLEEGCLQFGYNQKKICLLILNKPYVDGEDSEIVSIIDAKEYDEIAKIILFQNIVSYSGDYMSPDVKNAISDYVSLSSKGVHSPTLEDKKIYILSKKDISMKELNNMSYRLFTQIYDTLFDCDEYIASKIIQASEKYKVEEDIKHPLVNKKKTIFDMVFGSADALKNKISNGAKV